jgi:four helix bundle protein
MGTFRTFEEVEAWQQARTLAKIVYEASGKGAFGRDFALRDQIQRAAVSVMSNIAEGFGRGGTREFVQFLSVARGSASEVSAQLYVALDQGYVSKESFGQLQEQATRTGSVLSGLICCLRTAPMSGSKYRADDGSTER